MGPKGVIGAGFLIVATILFVVAGTQLVDANVIAWSGKRTTGTIIGHAVSGNRGGRATVYSFEDESGRRFEGQASIGFVGSGPNARARRAAEIGRRIIVYYDPIDPRRAVIDTLWGRWGHLFIMLFLLPHMLVGSYLVWSDRKDEREYDSGFWRP